MTSKTGEGNETVCHNYGAKEPPLFRHKVRHRQHLQHTLVVGIVLPTVTPPFYLRFQMPYSCQNSLPHQGIESGRQKCTALHRGRPLARSSCHLFRTLCVPLYCARPVLFVYQHYHHTASLSVLVGSVVEIEGCGLAVFLRLPPSTSSTICRKEVASNR